MDQVLPKQSLSLFESLPIDLVVALLSALISIADLHALIRASPAIYRIFLSAKRAVLVAIVARDLGPALRDAVGATLIAPTRFEDRVATYFDEIEKVIQRYKALPRSNGGLASASGLSADAAVAIVQLNRSVQFLIDEIAASKLKKLRKVHPGAGGSLTVNERRRLAQALLRHQILAHLECSPTLSRGAAVVHMFFDLLKPWEMHQLADIHSFVRWVQSCAFLHSKETELVDRRRHGRSKTRLQKEKDEALCNLGTLHRKIVAERKRLAADKGLTTAFLSSHCARTAMSKVSASAHFQFLIAGPISLHAGSGRMAEESRSLRHELYQRENSMPPLVPSEDDPSAPPFAWVDGHGSLDCQRWGTLARREVLPAGQEDIMARQQIWMRQKLDQWRWLGFPFWDVARVEMLKTRLPVFETGWLTVAPPPDEECEIYTAI
ncbi:uncharacterized protein ColSpa_04504 [Colletotrichum spaethianum]|uniref:Uncharacterized protein n=1 Tax=Colletotrichum spaethianum TaxID=700344 RepID=A0AA37L9I7_9PEZI|nr:uncharacterized protein ColSpa_04504 [Colletotrichum spaethianum]GKT44323.1 hypothetical protein ColSpa_04504 [Colletotrichum spaethianum]